MITRAAKIKEIERELMMRAQVYPRWIEAGRLSQHEADRRAAVLRAILYDLGRLPENEDQGNLFQSF